MKNNKLVLIALLLQTSAWADVMPSQTTLDRVMIDAQKQAAQDIAKVRSTSSNQIHVDPATVKMPEVHYQTQKILIPIPEQQGIDVKALAEQFEGLKEAARTQNTGAAMLFVSSSMPKNSLVNLLSQAQKYHMKVLFRGVPGENPLSIAALRNFVVSIHPLRYPEVNINPTAFQKFKIDRVPALVVASSTADQRVDEDGCATPTDFAVLHGDIPLDAALETISNKANSDEIRSIARKYYEFGRGDL